MQRGYTDDFWFADKESMLFTRDNNTPCFISEASQELEKEETMCFSLS